MWLEEWRALAEQRSPPPSFGFPASFRAFLQGLGAEELHEAWREVTPPETLPGSAPYVLAPDGARAAPQSDPPDLAALGAPAGERPVAVWLLTDAFAAYEGLVFALRGEEQFACASRRPIVLRMAAALRPSEIFPGGGPGGLRIDPRCLFLAHVLQGASADFDASGNFLYDEARIFGTEPFEPPGGDLAACVVHVDRLCPLLRLSGCNFMHFCAATLPVAVAALRAKLPPGTKFLVNPPPFARQFLMLLGVPEDDIIVYDARRVYHADELFLVDGLNEVADLPSCETVRAVRQDILAALPQAPAPPRPPCLLIIDRRGARGLSNAAAVEAALRQKAPQGLEVSRVSFEGLPIAEQIAEVQRCAVLVGVDGAGLTHSVFLPDGATVVDVLPTGDEFGPLPSRDGFGYIHHLATARGGLTFRLLAVPEAQWGSQQVECPLGALEVALDEWVSARPDLQPSTAREGTE